MKKCFTKESSEGGVNPHMGIGKERLSVSLCKTSKRITLSESESELRLLNEKSLELFKFK